ncbi:MAG: hypothetical protein AB8I58_07495 [Anaerolineales bacterium]|jgi:hypothetical protein
MKQILITIAILTFLLAACGPTPEPTMSPADVQGTAMAAAMSMVAETQAAIPTATPIPPTEAPTATPFPTNTVPPLDISQPTQSIATQSINILPTSTTAASVGGSDPCNQPLTSWDGESARMKIVNNTKPKGHVVIALGFTTTAFGQCGIISASFDNVTTVNVPVGTFWASAFIDGKQDFKAFGGDTLTRPGSYSLWVENDRIILKAGCAPDC